MISSNLYVDITSIVGGASAVSTRSLKPRLITTNELVPTGSVIEFSTLSSVLDYFSSTSPEYLQAAQMFSAVTKDGRKIKSMQFARWADVATSAQVFGAEVATLDQLKTYSTGAFNVTLDGSTSNITGLDFSAATSYADVATELQSTIQALGGDYTAATVTYSATRKGFNFDTNGTADGAISFSEVTASLLDDLGWNALAIYSAGIADQTLTAMQTAATSLNNNYHSFATVNQLTLDQSVELATWNTGYNNEFMYLPRCTKSEAVTWAPALSGYAGTGLVLFDSTKTTEYPWLHPAQVIGANVWTERAAAMNLKFTQNSALSAVIESDTDKATYDALRSNYFGVTQEAGTNLTFFQNGVLMGGNNSPEQMGVYAAEAWLKSEIKSSLLSAFLALKIVSADDVGRGQVEKYITAAAELGIFNGIISIGKQFSTTQKAYITDISGDTGVWQTVQREGYWFTTAVDSTGSEPIITYTLIYAKRDGVGKIEGRHILI